jgi:hypothetical protein
VTWVKRKLLFVHLKIVLILAQDTCLVCAEHTIGYEIILDMLDGILRDVGQVDTRICRFGIVLISLQDRFTVCVGVP